MAKDFNQLFRPTTWDDIVGQTDIKQIIMAAIDNGNFPKFSIFCGPSGIGKSCMAEVAAHALICESSEEHPCGKCVACTTQASRSIVKYNMAKMLGKKDIVAVLDEIFKFEGLFGKTVYILEEVQVLKQNEEQAPFLEELTKIPDDVYIMMCTTHINKLLPALRNRATIFQLTVPSTQDCVELIRTINERVGYKPMSQASMTALATLSENVPRSILKHMQLLASNGEISQESISQFFHTVSQYEFISCLGELTDPNEDTFSFVKYLEYSKTRISLAKLLSGLRGFVLTALIEASTKVADPSISRTDRKRMSEVMSKISMSDFLKVVEAIGKLPSDAFTDDREAEFQLITLKMRTLGLTAKQVRQDNRMQTAAARAQSVHHTKQFAGTERQDVKVTSDISEDELEAILGISGG